MKCLVTGSSGFIGSHLVEALLQRGYEVEGIDTAPSRFKIHLHLVDITDPEIITETINGFDYVFHLAGLLGTDELQSDAFRATMVNIGGTVNVLEACRQNGIRMILASKPNPWLNTYSITKIAAESFVEMYRLEHGLEAVVLRWFNVYGPYQPLMEKSGYKKLIPHAIMNILHGDPVEIYGDGKQMIDLIHTSDVVSAMLSVIDNWTRYEGGRFEIGHNVVSVNTAIDIISDIAGCLVTMKHLPMRKGEPLNSAVSANTHFFCRVMGWTQKMSLREGMTSTIKWYRDHYDESY